MLTLSDVGIPDYSEAAWKALTPWERLEELPRIRGVKVLSRVGSREDFARNVRFAYSLLDDTPPREIEEELGRLPEEILLGEALRRMGEIDSRVVDEWMVTYQRWFGPYFTNGFFCWFDDSSNTLHRRQKPDHAVARALDSLIATYGFAPPVDWCKYDGQRAIFPYFVQLIRDGVRGPEITDPKWITEWPDP